MSSKITFKKDIGNYKKGDTISVTNTEAQALKASGCAEIIKTETSKKTNGLWKK